MLQQQLRLNLLLNVFQVYFPLSFPHFIFFLEKHFVLKDFLFTGYGCILALLLIDSKGSTLFHKVYLVALIYCFPWTQNLGNRAQRKDDFHKSQHDFWRTTLFDHLNHPMLLLKLTFNYSYLAEADLWQILLGFSLTALFHTLHGKI